MPEFIPMLCLSTGHLPECVRADLEAITAPGADFEPGDWRHHLLVTAWFGYGWIVYVSEDDEADPPLPAALADALAFARRQRAGFVKFDVDVAPIADLPFYDA